jgi:putative ABC transport system permease protein
MLRRTPGFTAVAMLTLALGIGANTAIFSIVDAALLRPLPFSGSDRLVRVESTKNGEPLGGPSPMDMRDFARAARNFEGLIVYDHWRKNVSGILGSNEPEEMVVGLVPGSYFELLRMKPLLGRLFTGQENTFGKHYVAAIGSSFWRTRFASDPQIIGRTLRINGETYVIVAVMPDAIPQWMDQTSAPVSIWTPFAFADLWNEGARGVRGYESLGRLKEGVSYDQGRAELSALAAGLAREHPVDQGIGVTIEPLADTRAGSLRPVLLLLACAVGMVLLIACSNLAGLLLARNSVRYREIGIRAALGARRSRILRQLLLETLLLSVAGGAFGLLLSRAAFAILTRMGPASGSPYTSPLNALPQFWSGGVEPRVLLFTFAISIATALLFGLAPAFAGTRISLAETLREGGRADSAGAGRQRFRRMLVMAEMALSLVLVIAAGLLAQSIVRLERRNPGFRADHALKAHFYLPQTSYADSAAVTRFCDEFSRRVRALPGVLDASISTINPPASGRWQVTFAVDGITPSRIADLPAARFGVVDAAYIRTMGMSLVHGRDFADSDTAQGPPVALVNEALARRYFADRDPVGHRIRLEPASASGELTIVGVAGDFMNAGMAHPADPQIIALFRQQPNVNYGFKDIVVRTAVAPAQIASPVSRQLRLLDADVPLGEVETMTDFMNGQTSDARFTAALLGLFAGLGTILAVVGAYGVISYLVAQRTRELGVRKALGADSRDILWLVLRQGIAMGAAGVAFGLAGVAAVERFVSGLLYGVSGSDPWTLAGASLLLLLVAAAASAIPARRAMRIDPVQALRGE